MRKTVKNSDKKKFVLTKSVSESHNPLIDHNFFLFFLIFKSSISIQLYLSWHKQADY